MITIHCFIYGERERQHALISSSVDSVRVPPELLTLTDLPPGHLPPDTRWGPLFGCGPIQDGWALWRTFADPRATRAGMVQTHVRFLPRNALFALEDLEPVLASLPVQATDTIEVRPLEVEPPQPPPFPPLPPEYLDMVQALLQSRKPVVIAADLDVQAMIRALWRGLWPDARRQLVFRPGFSPETVSASVREGMAIVTPRALLSRWHGYVSIGERESASASSQPAVGALVGNAPPGLMLFLRKLEQPQGDLRKVGELQKAAEAYERLEQGRPEEYDWTVLLRRVALLAPDAGVASGLKAELIERVAKDIPSWAAPHVSSLANIKAESFGSAGRQLAGAISKWVVSHLQGTPEMVVELLKRITLSEGNEKWWVVAIWDGIKSWLHGESPGWRVIWMLWTQIDALIRQLGELLPAAAEAGLVASAPERLQSSIVERVAALAALRGWSELHGAVLAASELPAEEKVRRQAIFPQEPRSGLRVLARRMGGPSFVAQAIQQWVSPVIEVAQELVRETPQLLAALDPALAGWRGLWLDRTRAGIPVWDSIPNRDHVLAKLCEVMAGGEEINVELLIAIARTPGTHMLGVPRRAEVWARLPEEARELLLASTVKEWSRALQAGAVPQVAEEPLKRRCLQALDSVWPERYSVQPGAVLVLAGLPTSETILLRWFGALGRREFSLAEASHLGRLCHQHSWKELAQVAFSALSYGRTDLEPMLDECKGLLDWWDRQRLRWYGRGRVQHIPQKLAVFLSFAHADDALRRMLSNHLMPLVRDGSVELWDDRRLLPGQEWDPAIMSRLDKADVILLLVSSDFIASEYCQREMERALERHSRGEALTIPLILRDCTWKGMPFARLTALPRDGHPVMSDEWSSPDEALTDAVSRLRGMLSSRLP
jgi:hypothetical protein